MNREFGRLLLQAAAESGEGSELLKNTLHALLDRIDHLEQRLGNLSSKDSSPGDKTPHLFVREGHDRLARIRHGLTELTERMQRPYIVSSALQAVKDVLDTLAESGVCNSVILEGEPGTGKTQWPYSEVGREIQDGRNSMIIHVRIKDGMNAQDLLYSVDNVRRLSDAQARSQVPDAIREEAAKWKAKILSGEVNPAEDRAYLQFKAKMQAVEELSETGKDLDYINYIDLGPLGEAIRQSGEGRKVWLVFDEIEKGPPELMTGILDEIENLTFTIAETGMKITGDKRNLRIVITTNPEDPDKIPSSFRRRSLYHFLEYPTQEEMAGIVSLNFPSINKDLLNYALNVYYAYHEHPQIQKKPSTPELLAWIEILLRECGEGVPQDIPHKEILLKFKDDQAINTALQQMSDKEEAGRRVEREEVEHMRELRYLRKAASGARVFRLRPHVFSDYQAQSELKLIYAKLQRSNFHFITPESRPEDSYNEYNDDLTVFQRRQFQLVAPGFEDLGGGYYILTEEIEEIFAPIIDARVTTVTLRQFYEEFGISAEDLVFTEITERNSHYAQGSLRIGSEKNGNESIPRVYLINNVYVFENNYHDNISSHDSF